MLKSEENEIEENDLKALFEPKKQDKQIKHVVDLDFTFLQHNLAL